MTLKNLTDEQNNKIEESLELLKLYGEDKDIPSDLGAIIITLLKIIEELDSKIKEIKDDMPLVIRDH